MRSVVLAADPQAAFLDAWVFVEQQGAFFGSSAARAQFGESADRIAAGLEECETEIVELGALFLTKAQIEKARSEVSAFAEANPMTDAYARSAKLPSTAPAASRGNLEWIVSIPMSPFRVFQGIDEGAAAVREFTAVADRFARRIDQIPQEAAWEVQLVIHDAEQDPAFQRTIGSLEELAAAGTHASDTAARLPQDVRREVEALFAALDERHARLDATLTSVRATLDGATETVRRVEAVVEKAERPIADANETARGVAEAGAAWRGAVESWHAMVKDLYPPDATAPEKPPEEEARPFDVREYERAATQIAGAANEIRGSIESLRALLAEAETVAASGRLADSTRAAAAAARDEAEKLTNHVVIRVVQGAAAIVALWVGGVLLLRIRRRPPATPSDAPRREGGSA
jgi:hypothetical protein